MPAGPKVVATPPGVVKGGDPCDRFPASIPPAPEPHFGYDAGKRALDVACALILLIATAPVALSAMFAILVTSGRPVFFLQERLGVGGVAFRCAKFRTMVVDAEARKGELIHLNTTGGPAFKHPNDPRVEPVGRWLRAWSIDELPQLWNVLRGEMSMVGPRPLPTTENRYQGDQWRRLSVKPGLTGAWQTSGRSGVRWDEWMEMDLAYVRDRSLLVDLRIMLKTPVVVLTRRGAS